MLINAISDTEFSLDTNGYHFLICLGSYTNGNYIALPEWGVCTKAGSWNNVEYNANQLRRCKSEIVANAAEQIAEASRAYISGEIAS